MVAGPNGNGFGGGRSTRPVTGSTSGSKSVLGTDVLLEPFDEGAEITLLHGPELGPEFVVDRGIGFRDGVERKDRCLRAGVELLALAGRDRSQSD